MLKENGSRDQESMYRNPALQPVRECFYTLRGVIQEHGILYKDAPLNKTGQTLVNISLLGGYPDIFRVPLACSKCNPDNGEEWTPEPGDMVLVQFINGNFNEPIVTGFLYPPTNSLQAVSTEAPRYHRKRNGTWERIEKNGVRRVYVAADDILEVVGTCTIIVHGDTTLTSPNVTVHATGKVQLDTPLTELTGDLTVAGGITSTGTYGASGGKIQTPGDIQSTAGEVKDKVRAMSADRGIFNSHTHPGDSGGTTGAPTQQQ